MMDLWPRPLIIRAQLERPPGTNGQVAWEQAGPLWLVHYHTTVAGMPGALDCTARRTSPPAWRAIPFPQREGDGGLRCATNANHAELNTGVRYARSSHSLYWMGRRAAHPG